MNVFVIMIGTHQYTADNLDFCRIIGAVLLSHGHQNRQMHPVNITVIPHLKKQTENSNEGGRGAKAGEEGHSILLKKSAPCSPSFCQGRRVCFQFAKYICPPGDGCAIPLPQRVHPGVGHEGISVDSARHLSIGVWTSPAPVHRSVD
jgi:hypothetical protein